MILSFKIIMDTLAVLRWFGREMAFSAFIEESSRPSLVASFTDHFNSLYMKRCTLNANHMRQQKR